MSSRVRTGADRLDVDASLLFLRDSSALLMPVPSMALTASAPTESSAAGALSCDGTASATDVHGCSILRTFRSVAWSVRAYSAASRTTCLAILPFARSFAASSCALRFPLSSAFKNRLFRDQLGRRLQRCNCHGQRTE